MGDLKRAADRRSRRPGRRQGCERAGSIQVLRLHGELLVVDKSPQADPAARLVFEAPRRVRRIVVNPEVPEKVTAAVFEVAAKPATVGVPEVVAGLLAAAGA
jgi:hypothetical protein